MGELEGASQTSGVAIVVECDARGGVGREDGEAAVAGV